MDRTHVRRRRAALLALGMTIGIGFLSTRASALTGAARPAPARIVVVHRGDTVWGIARRLVGPAGDPRPMVQSLIERNHLRGAVVTVGERLVVPDA